MIFTSINERYAALRQANGGTLPANNAELRSSSNLKNPAPWILEALTGSSVSSAGPAVNDESALTLAAVYACNRVLASAFASLPVGLFRSNGTETLPATNRPEHALIAEDPSELYTSYTFRSTLQFHLGLRGNAYARIIRDGRMGVKELRILHPNYVRPFIKDGRLYYEVTPNSDMGDTSKKVEILFDYEVLHMKNMSTNGITGKSPIQVHRETIGIGLSNRNFVADIHKNGGRLRGALSHPNKLTPEEVENLRGGFINAVNSGKFPLLQNGVEFKQISLTPADAEYIRTHNLTALDICAIYGVPPHKIGILDRATFSNIEHQGIEYVQETLLPWAKNWEQELRRKLLPAELKRTHHFRFNLEGRMRGDTMSRYRAYAIARQWGWMNVDEVRHLENMNPLPDGQGEIFLSPMNMVPAEQYLDPNYDPNGDNNTDNNDATGTQSATN